MYVFCLSSRAFTSLLVMNETCTSVISDKVASLNGMLCVLTYLITSSLVKAGIRSEVGVIAFTPTGCCGVVAGGASFSLDVPPFVDVLPQLMSANITKIPRQKANILLRIGETSFL